MHKVEENKDYLDYVEPMDVLDGIDTLAELIYDAQVRKGFYDDEPLQVGDSLNVILQSKRVYLGNKVMLMVTELAELHEAIRKNIDKSEHIPEFSAMEEEVADTIIRLLDFAGYNKLRLGEAIKAKLRYNESRPYKHGKNF